MKTVTIKVNNSRILDSSERAYLEITSPTGKTIQLKKYYLSVANDEQKKVFLKFCGDQYTKFIGNKQATIREMEVLLQFSKLKFKYEN